MQDLEVIARFIKSRIPGFRSIEHATSIETGQTSQVWRLSDGNLSFILKSAMDETGGVEEPEGQSRIEFESRALNLFDNDVLLKNLATTRVRPVRNFGLLKEEKALLLEDLGNGPDITAWLRRPASATGLVAAAGLLGSFIGQLHARTSGSKSLADDFNNRAVQESRFIDFYNEIGPAMRKAGYSNWEEVDDKSQRLGLRFMDSGVCFTMGNLWPQSIVMVPQGIRLVDWEACHYGFPAQDVARLSAYLWMYAHVEEDLDARRRLRAFNQEFLRVYREIIRIEAPRSFEADDYFETHNVHFGCEILRSTVGDETRGFLYDGVRYHEHRKEAVSIATNSITGDSPFFSQR